MGKNEEGRDMSKELIERLRADAESTDDIGLCADAADCIEELEREIERKMSAAAFILKERDALQANNARLRDFIASAQVSSGVCCCGEAMDGHSSPMSCGHSPVDMWDYAVGKLLDAPSAISALEAYVAKAGEKMRTDAMQAADANNQFAAYDAIRALPGVTLEDLK